MGLPIVRSLQRDNFTQIPNDVFADKRLTLQDIGLLCYMLSNCDEWNYSINILIAACGKNGGTSIQTSVKNLQSAGYLKIDQHKNGGKFNGAVWTVYDAPQVRNPHTENPHTENPHTENPHTENPHMENPHMEIVHNNNTICNNTICNKNTCAKAVQLLNDLSGSSFRATTKTTQKLIAAREKDGYTLSDIEAVIRHQCGLWGKDAKMSKYLRPETLFGNKFEGYLSDARRNNPSQEHGYTLASLEDPWDVAVGGADGNV